MADKQSVKETPEELRNRNNEETQSNQGNQDKTTRT